MLAISVALAVAACGSEGQGQDAGAPVQQTSLAAPSESQPLIVATRNAATSYMIDRNEQPIGPEFDRVTAFAEAQGWRLQWEVRSSTAGVLEALVHGKAHLAAAGLSRTPQRDERFVASRSEPLVEGLGARSLFLQGSARGLAPGLRARHVGSKRRGLLPRSLELL